MAPPSLFLFHAKVIVQISRFKIWDYYFTYSCCTLMLLRIRIRIWIQIRIWIGTRSDSVFWVTRIRIRYKKRTRILSQQTDDPGKSTFLDIHTLCKIQFPQKNNVWSLTLSVITRCLKKVKNDILFAQNKLGISK